MTSSWFHFLAEIETVLWHLLLALLITCLLLELVGMGLSLYLSMQVYPCRTAEGVVISEGPTCRVAPSYGGTEAGDTWAAPREDDMPECPKHMKAINDTLTAVTFILMTLHAVKSALEGAAEESHRDKTSSWFIDGALYSWERTLLLRPWDKHFLTIIHCIYP